MPIKNTSICPKCLGTLNENDLDNIYCPHCSLQKDLSLHVKSIGVSKLCPKCRVITSFCSHANEHGQWSALFCEECGYKEKEQSLYNRTPYENKCDHCGKKHLLLGKIYDQYTEALVKIGVLCDCGEVVWFALPI